MLKKKTNMINLKHMKARFSDGKSWKNPEVIGLNVVIVLIYVVGLLCFHKSIENATLSFKKNTL